MRAADFVAIARADAAERGADAFAAGGLIEQLVLGNMPGKDNVRPIAEPQIAANLDALRRERLDFLEDRGWVDDDAGRDDVHYSGRQDPAGNVVQLIGLVADHDRMA